MKISVHKYSGVWRGSNQVLKRRILQNEHSSTELAGPSSSCFNCFNIIKFLCKCSTFPAFLINFIIQFCSNVQIFPTFLVFFIFMLQLNFCLSFEWRNNHNSVNSQPRKTGFKTSPYSNLETGLKSVLFSYRSGQEDRDMSNSGDGHVWWRCIF